MKFLFYFILFIILFTNNTFAQFPNLVPNPSFETINTVAPTRFAAKAASFDSIMTHWHTTNITSPDVLSAQLKDKTRSYKIPVPKSGKIAIGLINNLGMWTEYVSVELNEPLIKGKTYYAEFWYMVLADAKENSNRSQNNPNFGIWFHHNMSFKTKGYIQAQPQIASDQNNDCPSYNWQKISGTFIADENYSHLCLGQFETNFQGALNGCIAIDDVLVKETEPEIKMEIGETIVLDDIIFKSGTAILEKSSYSSLKKLRKSLLSNKEICLAINGHTDNIGSEEDNMALSTDRAQAIYTYLLEQGINKGRLTFKGFGEQQPIKNNDTSLGRKKNRRVEFKILESSITQ